MKTEQQSNQTLTLTSLTTPALCRELAEAQKRLDNGNMLLEKYDDHLNQYGLKGLSVLDIWDYYDSVKVLEAEILKRKT